MLCVSTWLSTIRSRWLPLQSSISQTVLSTPIPGLILLQGKRFDEIPYYFPDGSVFGLVNSAAQRCLLNPPADTCVQKGDALIMMRPTSIASDAYKPLPRPIAVSPGEVVPAAAAHCLLHAGQPHHGQQRLSKPACPEAHLSQIGWSGLAA